jgi:outer membrane lipoprotein SlyB
MTSRARMPTLVLALGLAVAACAGPQPVLYPNPHLKQVGQTRADGDIAECRRQAEAAGATGSAATTAGGAATSAGTGAVVGAAAGAVGGAIGGSAGTGAAIGAASGATAGLISSLFGGAQVSPAYKSFVERCLRERGYDIVGWD